MALDISMKRILSCLVDHFVFTAIAGVFIFPGIVIDMFSNPFFLTFYSGSLVLNTIGLSIYLGKDFLLDQSIGKRIFGLVVMSNQGGGAPNPLQLVLRNATFFLWPVEVLLLLVEPHRRRLDDRLTGTRVGLLEERQPKFGRVTNHFYSVLAFFLLISISYAFAFSFAFIIEKMNFFIDN